MPRKLAWGVPFGPNRTKAKNWLKMIEKQNSVIAKTAETLRIDGIEFLYV
jgi:hypothetical protein